MANKPKVFGDSGLEGPKRYQQHVRITETKTLDVDVDGEIGDDRLSRIVEDVRPELEEAGLIRRIAGEDLPGKYEVPGLTVLKVALRAAALIGAFALAYKGFDVILSAATSAEGAQGVAKTIGEWLTAFGPFIKVILGLGASAGTNRLLRR
jgi:hypothetical protein